MVIYVLKYRLNRKWVSWGYNTSDLQEMKKKIEAARRLTKGRIALKYEAQTAKRHT